MTPMLARDLEDYVDPTGWWLSEKLDGVRAVWTGEVLRSRNGNRFHAPAWFTNALPSGTWLDGELWLGRGRFQETAGIVRKATPVDAEWHALRFHVFDAPKAPEPFEQRLAVCSSILRGCPVARVVPHWACKGRDHLAAELQAVLASGAEGLCLRRADSAYREGRSPDLRRLKGAETEEAAFVGLQGNALLCRWQGLDVRLGGGLAESFKRRPPHVGARVTFRFKGRFDSGLPREPVFVSVRDYE